MPIATERVSETVCSKNEDIRVIALLRFLSQFWLGIKTGVSLLYIQMSFGLVC